MSIILYAIPVFFLLIAIELVLEKAKNTSYYRLNDAVNSLSIGVLSRVTGVVKQLIPFTIYFAVFEHIALFNLSESLWVWVFAFVIYDFLYYWNHRLGHEISFLWAAHVVHHSSEEYNLTTALRQTSGSIVSWVFYLPLAVVGVDPIIFISVASLNLVYQFWVHTRHVPKLGWYEWFFVSPSNHRVHHAQNEIYLDRNYGGVFIVWDRLFGTFQEELDDEKPIYGVRKALKSWDPIKANWQVYAQLVKDSWRTERFIDKLRVWFGRTGWRPEDVSEKYPLEGSDLTQFKKFNTVLSLSTKIYCLVQYVLTVVLALLLMLNAKDFAYPMLFGLAAFVTFSLFSIGMVMENRAFSMPLEWCKNALVLLSSFTVIEADWLALTLQVGTVLSLVFLYLSSRHIPQSESMEQSQPSKY